VIVLLTGPNDFAIHQAVQSLIASFSAKHGANGVERVNVAELTPMQLPDLLQGLSLFASHRLVIMSEASVNKAVWEKLADMSPLIPAEITLVLVEPSPDKRTKTYKTLLTFAKLQNCPDLAEPELAKWAAERIKKAGGHIRSEDVNYLIARVGTNQWRLSTEIDKLLIFQPEISRATINELTEASPEASAFTLLDMALAGDASGAQKMVQTLSVNEDPYKFFGLLSSQVYALALLAEAGQATTPESIAKDTGVHPFVLKKNKNLAKGLGGARLRQIVNDVAQCDVQIKTTGHDTWQLIGLTLGKIAAR
jgi:DNA polymerase III delta subunit